MFTLHINHLNRHNKCYRFAVIKTKNELFDENTKTESRRSIESLWPSDRGRGPRPLLILMMILLRKLLVKIGYDLRLLYIYYRLQGKEIRVKPRAVARP